MSKTPTRAIDRTASREGAPIVDGVRERVVLKKYGNRRLYDTRASTYVTLAEVESLLVAGEDVEVRDAKTGDDITKEILVQIIAEREGTKDALPLSFLKDVVRLGTAPARRQFADALTSSMGAMVEAQRTMAAEMQRAAASLAPSFINPFSMFFRAPSHLSTPQHLAGQGAAMAPVAPQPSEDMRALKAELDATKALVHELVHATRSSRAADENAAAAKDDGAPLARRSRRTAISPRQKRSDSRGA